MPEYKEFRCADCPEHSGTQATIRHLEEAHVECKRDRAVIRGTMEEQNRRISEKVTIKVALWTSGIAVTIFLTVISITLQTSARIENKVDSLATDVEVIKALASERAIHAKQHTELLQELKKFREQEAQDFQEGKTLREWQSPYGKPGEKDR